MASGRRQYPFHLIEPKWQAHWEKHQTFRAWNPGERIPADHPSAARHDQTPPENLPKYYILDMFPYPSGAGLHVGHPEGYTATDILARYNRARGFNVLHPMGWDAFGLPAEQYAVKTGQHPRQTTEQNIATFKRQIRSLGFSYDWTREVDTTDPEYFKWTQWIFLQLYNGWHNPETRRAEPVSTLAYPPELEKDEAKRRAWRDSKRLAYVSHAPVWWCEQLGTVLANEEVVDGKSDIGGFPVIRKPMRQWMLRITAYAERLLGDLETIEWTDSLKEMQRNWIGRSEGAEVDFEVWGLGSITARPEKLRVFTTRPDTLFGATYMVVAPEHDLVDRLQKMGSDWETFTARTNDQIQADRVALMEPNGKTVTLSRTEALARARMAMQDLIEMDSQTSPPLCRIGEYSMLRQELTSRAREIKTQAAAVAAYRTEVAKKSDLERTELAKEKTGVFTGAYAINPVSGGYIPIWIADYVLASYGTGAIMAVPGHDDRDLAFARKFNLPIIQVVQPPEGMAWEGFVDDGVAVNSAHEDLSLDGLPTPEAKRRITAWLESKGLGQKTINYKLRDWLFSRQRYWGEPFPILWKKDAHGQSYHEALPESALPLRPPPLDDYKPTPDGQPPLARAREWVNLPDGVSRETNTMPQWAGSCWYYLRYLDSRNSKNFCDPTVERYWMGRRKESRNAVINGHTPIESTGVDLYVGGTEHAVLHLLYARFWHKVLFDLGHVSTAEPFFRLVNQGLILGEDGQKMSKSLGNVINPDTILQEYGADAFRLYEMFMGPLEMTKPWNTKGVEGVYRFLGKVWRLFVDEESETALEQTLTVEPNAGPEALELTKLHGAIQMLAPTASQRKALHQCIKKVTEDLDGLRFNTAIAALMIFINEAMTWTARPAEVLRDFLVLLQPLAPHLAEELWSKFQAAGYAPSRALAYVEWPAFDPALLVEDTLEIPVQVNGKLRDVLNVPAAISAKELEVLALASEKVKQFLNGKAVKKVVVVPKKLVNVVAA